MEHIFVINPYAGKHDSTEEVTQKVRDYAVGHPGFSHSIYVTKASGDATVFVKKWISDHPDIHVRFYSCGGDGTLNEVVTGIIDGAGDPQKVQVTVHANGSGNDYIKYYATHADFTDVALLVDGAPHPVDVMKVNDRYSINVIDIGFDATVCKTGNDLKHKPLIGGRNSYTTGIVKGLFTARTNYVRMSVDGQPFFDGYMLLTTLSNGRFHGGRFMCAPRSKNDDGLVEVTLIKPMSLVRFAQLLGDYTDGTFLDDRKARQHIQYRQGATVEVASNEAFWLVIDGEMLHSKHYRVQNLRHAVTFVAPKAR